MLKYLLWLLYFIPALLVEIVCWLTNPIACFFVEKKYRKDKAKRLGPGVHTLKREYLKGIWYFWQTHDNAVDEGWYGKYDIVFLSKTTQQDYDNSALIRYWCRVWWLTRNTAYGWHYLLFSRKKEPSGYLRTAGDENKGFWYSLKSYVHSFQFEAHIPIFNARYISINIGWKAHKDMTRLLYANRVFSLRKYQ